MIFEPTLYVRNGISKQQDLFAERTLLVRIKVILRFCYRKSLGPLASQLFTLVFRKFVRVARARGF